ncbi:uncharacterized protein LAESUDRAFT_420286 [Laetiporus sulphureus 93-53]|uniref:Uncharacterized protein n=1 Tax=Laetiporus sulphureus 93-53 TaxID=1314785 RepID=A0A165GGP2_9APHY|nr:uncharacterized protein LAESUDRAFT_420286 [Laetiporus sulphureus 93-53]KZT10319.1 hypothetical protein LAESUDRAFT_420286 [Laetiporus sulphureus 93-53]
MRLARAAPVTDTLIMLHCTCRARYTKQSHITLALCNCNAVAASLCLKESGERQCDLGEWSHMQMQRADGVLNATGSLRIVRSADGKRHRGFRRASESQQPSCAWRSLAFTPMEQCVERKHSFNKENMEV